VEGNCVKLKLDEDLSRHLKPRLETLRHDVMTAGEEGLLSQPDSAIAAAASREGRMILTLDLDFADLRKYPPGTHPGIILFRPDSFGPLAVNQFIENFIATSDLEALASCLVIVERSRVRIRRPDA
jgi:predicted nuclease of predicted toxin-antitoxin system